MPPRARRKPQRRRASNGARSERGFAAWRGTRGLVGSRRSPSPRCHSSGARAREDGDPRIVGRGDVDVLGLTLPRLKLEELLGDAVGRPRLPEPVASLRIEGRAIERVRGVDLQRGGGLEA
eukprot:CAMPEP_0115362118 /NCGR_PEP_ID=MMETSP0270-20121206/102545_1 /TAXON_ID=71861 /ORGANISM="Scrippsiella trochoidea, Strain CCMP3099" /LENGTH=120 /DNA_ID=CAMNT_0002784689 /DNA_START=78 /DNA_END=440 /DNA_ORIENTATION=-